MSIARVAILIVSYNGRQFLDDCLTSLRAAAMVGIEAKVFVVDNASTDNTVEWLREKFPECSVTASPDNLGFAQGNNLAWATAKLDGVSWDAVYLLNQDTVVDSSFLIHASDYLNKHQEAGAVQSMLMLHPDTHLINTSGNSLHFLGFGLVRDFGCVPNASVTDGEIGYPSGAGVLIRASLLETVGLFSKNLFMYLEDAELGWKLRLINQPAHVCTRSVVYHKYKLGALNRNYMYLERNRWWIILVYYRVATLVLMMPALMLMELGQWYFAFRNGLLLPRMKVIAYFWDLGHWREICAGRKAVASWRLQSDRQVLRSMSGSIASPHFDSWLLAKVANPVLEVYLQAIRRIVFW